VSSLERGRVVVLNGGSSSGKTAIARRLQAGLDGTWLVLGVDLFLWTLPSRLFADPAGFDVAGGVITRGEEFMRLYGAFQSATATLADRGVDILIDEVLLDGARDQRSWIAALKDLEVCWIAVHCDPELAEARAAQRGDRITGAARVQAESVHEGVRYDFEVDTGGLDADQSARVVADHLRARWPSLGVSTSHVAFTYPLTSAWTARGSIRPAPWERRPTPEVE
jgi:chloramphenicol 3-O phosphotransferase